MKSMCRFHHVGLLTRNIADATGLLKRQNYKIGEVVRDENQKCDLVLCKRADSPLLELVKPFDEEHVLSAHTERNGIGPYHLCYEVQGSLFDSRHFFGGQRHVRTVDWTPAPLFQGRRVSFYFSTSFGLVEFLDSE
jgi:methylmalonyl-CoA/ethylmalonyl-CoA epimerase